MRDDLIIGCTDQDFSDIADGAEGWIRQQNRHAPNAGSRVRQGIIGDQPISQLCQ